MFEEPSGESQTEAGAKSPWQFSLRALLLVTAAVAGVCSLVAWWGVPIILAILGAAGGAFVGALICPAVGLDSVLDDPRADVPRCFGLAAYLVGGTWGMVAGLKWLLGQVYSQETPVFVSGGLILFFVFTAGLVARLLWPDSDTVEAVIVTIGALIGIFTALSLWAIA